MSCFLRHHGFVCQCGISAIYFLSALCKRTLTQLGKLGRTRFLSLDQLLCVAGNCHHKLNIWANGNQIDEVQEFNFLDITIDQNITWNLHIRKISIKISRVIGVLRKLKRIFPQYILRLLHNSLIHPHLIYGLNLWGFKHKRITILQKKL